MAHAGGSRSVVARWVGFLAWMVVGAGLGLGLLSLLTIGPVVLAATVVAAGMIGFWRRSLAEAFGAVAGIAGPLFYVGYLNWNGPGTVCTSTAGGTECTDEWAPWPWFAAGLVFAAVGVIGFVYRYRLGLRVAVRSRFRS